LNRRAVPPFTLRPWRGYSTDFRARDDSGMTLLSTAETVMRPASAALEAWFPASVAEPSGAARAALVAEQAEVTAAIAGIVARMGAELDADALDDLTDETTALFARAEEIRLALAPAGLAADGHPADEPWLLSLDLD
jgi:hypothetical protein